MVNRKHIHTGGLQMKRSFTLTMILFLCCSLTVSFAENAGNTAALQGLEELQENYILVEYKDGTTEYREISEFVNVSETKTKETVLLSALAQRTQQEQDQTGSTSIDLAVSKAKEQDNIRTAEPVIIYSALSVPSDLITTDSWRHDFTNMNQVWDEISSVDLNGITVAVIDTGVAMANPDFNLVGGKDFVDGDTYPDDENGHGTHVAGLIGAKRDNGTGTVGIAPGVKIIPVRVLNRFGKGATLDIANGIKWAADQGADVINLSLGGYSQSSVLYDAVNYAHSRGCIVVAATGNDSNHWLANELGQENFSAEPSVEPFYSKQVMFPAAYAEVLSVGSVQNINNQKYISDFSNISKEIYGSILMNGGKVDIVAPGSNIWSNALATNYITNKSGTSMATPHVSGLAALIKAKHGGLVDNEGVAHIIKNTANADGIFTPLSFEHSKGYYNYLRPTDFYGHGLIDIQKAIAFNFTDFKALSISANGVGWIDGYDDEIDLKEHSSRSFFIKEDAANIVISGSSYYNDDAYTVQVNGTVHSFDKLDNAIIPIANADNNEVIISSTWTQNPYVFNVHKKNNTFIKDLKIQGSTRSYPFYSNLQVNEVLVEAADSYVDLTAELLNGGDYIEISGERTNKKRIELIPGIVKSIPIKVYSKADNGEILENTYILRLNRKFELRFSEILINGENVSGFDPSLMNYTLNSVPFESEKIAIAAKAMASGIQVEVRVNNILQSEVNNGDHTAYLKAGSNNIIEVKGILSATRQSSYLLTVYREQDSRLSAISIDGQNISNYDMAQLDYDLDTVPYSKDTIVLNSTATDPSAKVETVVNGLSVPNTAPIALTAGVRNKICLSVTSSDSKVRVYTIYISRDAGNSLSAIMLNGKSIEGFDSSTLEYSPENFNFETDQVTLKPQRTYDAATLSWSENGEDYQSLDAATIDQGIAINLAPGVKKKVNFKVISDNGLQKVYTVNLYRAADNTLAGITVDGSVLENFNPTISNYDLANRLYDKGTLTLQPIKSDVDASVKIAVNEDDFSADIADASGLDTAVNLAPSQKNTLKIKVTAKDGSERIYTLTAYREFEPGLGTVSFDGVALEAFATETSEYTLDQVAFEKDAVKLELIALSNKHRLMIDSGNGDYTDFADENSVVSLAEGSDNIIKVKVIAELGTERDYSFKLYRKNNNSLKAIMINDIALDGFQPAVLEYPISISIGEDSTVLTAIPSSEEASVAVAVNGSEFSEESLVGNKLPIAFDATGKSSVQIKVTGKDKHSRIYSLDFYKEKDTRLSNIKIDGNPVSNYDPDKISYALNSVEYEKGQITLNCEKFNANSKVQIAVNNIYNPSDDLSGQSHGINLVSGTTNHISIKVIAEDQSTRIYSLSIFRNSEPVKPVAPPNTGNNTIGSGGSSGGNSGGGGSGNNGGSSGGTAVFIPPFVIPSSSPPPEPPKVHVWETTIDAEGNEVIELNVSEDKLLEDLYDNSTEFVEIIATNDHNGEISNDDENDDYDDINVALDLSALKAITNGKKSVEVKFEDVTFKVENETIKALNIKKSLKISSKTISSEESALLNGTIQEATAGNAVSNVYELDMFDGNDKITNLAKSIPIILDYDDKKIQDKDKVAVYYFNKEKNTWEYVGGKVLADGKIEFKARHFSKYAIREYNKTFEDIQGHWAQENIEILASRKISNGVSETEFAPNNSITNAEFIALISRILSLEDSDCELKYLDVKDGAWYEQCVKNAYKAGLLGDAYSFYLDPNRPIKREVMADIVVKAYFYYTGQEPGDIMTTQEVNFNDEGAISYFFRSNVRLANSLGVITGDELGNFNPKNGATRAEASTVIKRLLKALELM